MRIIQSSIFRALCAIVVGVLLIKYPGNAVTWLTMVIGIIFLLSGVFSCLAYLNARRHAGEYLITDAEGKVISGGTPVFPIVGIGSIILGATLIFVPAEFLELLIYILGIILVLGATSQFMMLFNARKWGSVSWGFWICPSLILLSGLFVLFYPKETMEIPMLILGWCCLLYGVTEIVNTLKIQLKRRAMEKSIAEAQQAEQSGSDEENVVTIDTVDDDEDKS